MGASRLKPLTVKEVEKLTAVRPSSIKHRSLGGIPGFVLVHTPAGHSSYGLIYRRNGERKKLTLGTTKTLTLGEARALAGRNRANIEGGGDPHADKLAERQQAELKRHVEVEQQRLDVEALWDKYMQLVASQLRSRSEKNRIFRRYILPVVCGLPVTEIHRLKTESSRSGDPLLQRHLYLAAGGPKVRQLRAQKGDVKGRALPAA